MLSEIGDKGKKISLTIPKLSPLKVNSIHFETNLNCHKKLSQDQFHKNLLFTEIKNSRKKFKHPSLGKIRHFSNNEYQHNTLEDNKFKQIEMLIGDLIKNGSVNIKNKILFLCKDVIQKLNEKETGKLGTSYSTNDIYEEKIMDLNLKFDYLSKENEKIKTFLNKKFNDINSMYKEFSIFNSKVKTLNLGKLKLLNPKRKTINISHLLKNKEKNHSKIEDTEASNKSLQKTKFQRNLTEININNNFQNNGNDLSNLTFNEIEYSNHKAQTEITES